MVTIHGVSKSKYQLQGEDLRKYLSDKTNHNIHSIRDHQLQALDKTRSYFFSDKDADQEHAIILAPTGSGKTGIACLLPYYLDAGRTLFITPSKIFTSRILGNMGITKRTSFLWKTGIIGNKDDARDCTETVGAIFNKDLFNDPHNLNYNCVIVNAQKLSKKDLIYENQDIITNFETFCSQFDLLVVNEAHHFPAKTWINLVNAFMNKTVHSDSDTESDDEETKEMRKVVFLTAALYRNINADKKSILSDFAEAGMNPKVVMEINGTQLLGTFTKKLTFHTLSTRGQSFMNEQLFDDIKVIFGEDLHSTSKQAIILVKSSSVARLIAQILNDLYNDDKKYFPTFAIAITTKQDKESFKKFSAGDYKIAVTSGRVTEEYDMPTNVAALGILRKIEDRSRIFFSQLIRKFENIKFAELQVFSYPEFEFDTFRKSLAFIAEDDPTEKFY